MHLRIPIIFLITLLSSHVLADCNDNAQIRLVNDDNADGVRLYSTIKGKGPSWSDEFHQEEFSYIGKLENSIEVAMIFTSWGVSTCRGTTRLLLFKDERYLGAYSINPFDGEIKLRGNKIIFPYSKTEGNEIDLSKGIPNEVWLDGELPGFGKSEL